MSRLPQYTYLASLVLVFGGLIALGAFAGTRVAFGVSMRILDCTVLSDTRCVPLLQRLNQLAQTFAAGGVVAMVCGGIGLWSARRQAASNADA